MQTTIALDAMGGDQGSAVTVPAAVDVLRTHANVRLILVGDEAILSPLLSRYAAEFTDRITLHHASEVVGMDEPPSQALRSKKDSSMRVAINLVHQGQAQACVSAGNTGALMATARYVLKTLPGIDRPAISTQFPTQDDGEVRILDLGANIDSTPQHLYQFAVMGSILSSAIDNIENPRVGLLNIGEEEIKGNELVKKSAELLANSRAINYVGYVEGDSMFRGVVDVVVCDGFIGNITLKAVEGAVKMMAKIAKETIQRSWWTKLLVLPALPVLKQAVKRVDPERHNGATLLGLNGIVVKSHGSASIKAFSYAIREAIVEVEKNVPQLIKEKVSNALADEA